MRNYWLGAAIAWMIFIAFVCLARFDELPSVSLELVPTDKIVHGALHFMLTFLLARSLRRMPLLGSFCISVAFGIAIEAAQAMFTSYRTADIADIAANIAGSILALVILKLTQKKPFS